MHNKRIAVIPARSGSKRIPRKNIKVFCGKPIISYSIQAVLRTDLFDEVMVSTDDDEIAEIGVRYGASVPFFRSSETSDDYSGPGDVVHEVLAKYKIQGKDFDTACCVFATAPLINYEKIIMAVKMLENNDFDCIYSVGRFEAPIWRSFAMTDSGLVFNFPKHAKSRSQDLPAAFYDAGQFYCFNIPSFLKLDNKNYFGERKGAVVIDSMNIQDIDDMEDWKLAEIKAKYIEATSG